MDWKSELIAVLKEYGPAFGVLVISYFRDQAIKAKHDEAIAELEKKHLENKDAIEKKYQGLSSDDVITRAGDGKG